MDKFNFDSAIKFNFEINFAFNAIGVLVSQLVNPLSYLNASSMSHSAYRKLYDKEKCPKARAFFKKRSKNSDSIWV
jgi:hypothetical protein